MVRVVTIYKPSIQPSRKSPCDNNDELHFIHSGRADFAKRNTLRISYTSLLPFIINEINFSHGKESEEIQVYPARSNNIRSRVLAAISILRKTIVVNGPPSMSEADFMQTCELVLKDITLRHVMRISRIVLSGKNGSTARNLLWAFYENRYPARSLQVDGRLN